MHEEAAQERAECREVVAELIGYQLVGLMVMIAFDMAP
jgi:hypothetical protein